MCEQCENLIASKFPNAQRTQAWRMHELDQLHHLNRALLGKEIWNHWAQNVHRYRTIENDEIIDFSEGQPKGLIKIDSLDLSEFIFMHHVKLARLRLEEDLVLNEIKANGIDVHLIDIIAKSALNISIPTNTNLNLYQVRAYRNSSISIQNASGYVMIKNCLYKGLLQFPKLKTTQVSIIDSKILDDCFIDQLDIYKLNMSGSKFEKKFDISNLKIANNLSIFNSTFSKFSIIKNHFNAQTSITDCEFKHEFCLEDSTFEKSFIFNGNYIDTEEKTSRYWAHFSNTTFRDHAHFQENTFTIGVSFNKTKFENPVSILNCDLGRMCEFFNATFGSNTNFENCKFSGNSKFSFSEFSRLTSFQDCAFKGATDFSNAQAAGAFSIENSKFYGELNFSNFIANGAISFDQCDFIVDHSIDQTAKIIPDFQFAKFEITPNLSFINVQLPPRNVVKSWHKPLMKLGWITPFELPVEDEKAAAKLRKLKLLASDSHNHFLEKVFFRKELLASLVHEAKNKPHQWLIRAYDAFCKCGLSIKRPFIYLCLSFAFFSALYSIFTQTGYAPDNFIERACDLIHFSGFNTLPFLGVLNSSSDPVAMKLFGESLGGMLSFWTVVQNIVSAFFLFLTLLGIRNRFKL